MCSGTYNCNGQNWFSKIHCNTVNQANCCFQCRLYNANKTGKIIIHSFNMCLLTSDDFGTKERIREQGENSIEYILVKLKKKIKENLT